MLVSKDVKIRKKCIMIKTTKTTAVDLINETINRGNQIWLTTDWHLITFNKENGSISKRSNYNQIINTYSQIPENDLIINLGDLIDSEVEDPYHLNMLRKDLAKIKASMILIRGNNDVLPKEFYTDTLGIDVFIDGNSFLYKDLLFSHACEENNVRINVHGHSHFSCRYYLISPTNQVDIFNVNRDPINFNDIDKVYKDYWENNNIEDLTYLGFKTSADYKAWLKATGQGNGKGNRQ